MCINVLIADDHGVVRAGLRALIEAEQDLSVVGQAADGDTAFALAMELRPDVVLADINMPGLNGIDLTRHLQDALPSSRVVILTMHEDAGLLRAAFTAGAKGYVMKRGIESELMDAIRAAARGETYVHTGMAWALRPEPVKKKANVSEPAADLTERERQVLRLIGQGQTNRQVADALKLTSDVVDHLRAELLQKLDLHSRVELIGYARQHSV